MYRHPLLPDFSSYWRRYGLLATASSLLFRCSWPTSSCVRPSHGQVTAVRNGADVLLKSLFVAVGGRYGLALFGAVMIGGGAALAWRDFRRAGGIRFQYLAGMFAESIAYALVFGMVAGTLTVLLLLISRL